MYGDAIETIQAILGSQAVSQRELADRLGVSEARVSKMLAAPHNMTLRTLADVGWALGIRFEAQAAVMADRGETPAAGDPSPGEWVLGG